MKFLSWITILKKKLKELASQEKPNYPCGSLFQDRIVEKDVKETNLKLSESLRQQIRDKESRVCQLLAKESQEEKEIAEKNKFE